MCALQTSSSHLSPGKRCGATAQSAPGWYTDPVLVSQRYVRRVYSRVVYFVTLVGASWVVVAGDQAGVDFIPMKFCGAYRVALRSG
eukprot:scaffold92466_cov36-Phaeocystis_antarctica.AAC.1